MEYIHVYTSVNTFQSENLGLSMSKANGTFVLPTNRNLGERIHVTETNVQTACALSLGGEQYGMLNVILKNEYICFCCFRTSGEAHACKILSMSNTLSSVGKPFY